MTERTHSYDEIMGRYFTDAVFHAEVEATRKLMAQGGRAVDTDLVAVILHYRDSAAMALSATPQTPPHAQQSTGKTVSPTRSGPHAT